MGSVLCKARTIVLEHSAAQMIDALVTNFPDFDIAYRDIEMMLAMCPAEVGIKGVICGGLGIGLYLHISNGFPPIDVLYKYNDEKVYVESIVVGIQVGSTVSKNRAAS